MQKNTKLQLHSFNIKPKFDDADPDKDTEQAYDVIMEEGKSKLNPIFVDNIKESTSMHLIRCILDGIHNMKDWFVCFEKYLTLSGIANEIKLCQMPEQIPDVILEEDEQDNSMKIA